MTIKRMDNVLIVVDDLDAVKAFFIGLGIELAGVPEGCDLDAIEAAILHVPGVRSLHDLHL